MARLRLGFCALLGAVLSMTACFSPDRPACAFSCIADGVCPTAYACGSDGLCHRDDGAGVCGLDSRVDGGDAGPRGGGADGAAD